MALVRLGYGQTGETLARMVAKGRATLEHFDQPPADWPADRDYQNMARDWIKVNPSRWEEIKTEFDFSLEAVEASPSPRDLMPTPTESPIF